jgi:hypothetical protein
MAHPLPLPRTSVTWNVSLGSGALSLVIATEKDFWVSVVKLIVRRPPAKSRPDFALPSTVLTSTADGFKAASRWTVTRT